jgi:hypothetical protein
MFFFLACYFVSPYGTVDVVMNLNEICHYVIEVLMWHFPAQTERRLRKILKGHEVIYVTVEIEFGPLSGSSQKHYCLNCLKQRAVWNVTPCGLINGMAFYRNLHA